MALHPEVIPLDEEIKKRAKRRKSPQARSIPFGGRGLAVGRKRTSPRVGATRLPPGQAKKGMLPSPGPMNREITSTRLGQRGGGAKGGYGGSPFRQKARQLRERLT